ncbi:MAG: acyl-phosphate glycerol 3-phosphate acyltransferase [Proteobacteria bacterium]|nr:MAG: acyl-phosphate glycerol 3-phosphate acyltransferase [Pseudomonadota bacterium]
MSRRQTLPPPPSSGSAPLGQAPAGHPPRRFLDGAAARRAAEVVGESAVDAADARPAAGRSLDLAAPQGGHETPTTEQALIRRMTSSLATTAPGRLTSRLGAALALGSVTRWLRHARMRTRSEVVDPFGLDPVVSERWRPFFEFLYRSWWRVETSGMEHVPDFGRALVVVNHGGTLPYDSLMLMYAIRYDHPAHRTIRPLIEDVVYQLPFLGVLLNRLGCIRASQENAERLLREETLIAVFPEGGKGTGKLYRDRYRLQRFGRGGFVKLALRMGTPIIPAAMLGPEDAHPLLARLGLGPRSPLPFLPITPTFPWLGPFGLIPRRDRWLMTFGAAIDLSSHGPEAEHDSLLVTRVNDQVRSTIQQMLDELVERRERDSPPPPAQDERSRREGDG